MFTKKLTTISIATLATFGAMALSLESASARPGGHGFRGGGGGHGIMRHGGFRPGHWGHRRGWGFYGAPIYASVGAYALDCYYVRRRGVLLKVCD